MPRRIIVSKDEIYKRRACAWELHYANRGFARELALNCETVLNALTRYVPEIDLDLDGSLIKTPEFLRGRQAALAALDLPSRFCDFMLHWYWSELHWLEFVRKYQALPEVYGPHYLKYERVSDTMMLRPVDKLSSPVGKSAKTVDNYVGNFGASTRKKVQLCRNPVPVVVR